MMPEPIQEKGETPPLTAAHHLHFLQFLKTFSFKMFLPCCSCFAILYDLEIGTMAQNVQVSWKLHFYSLCTGDNTTSTAIWQIKIEKFY